MSGRAGKRYLRCWPMLLVLPLISGCMAALDLAVTGAGKSAQVENIGFFKSTEGLKSETDIRYPGLPDYYFIQPNVNWAKYQKVLIADFSSLTTDVSNVRSLQISEYKNIKKDIPDHISQAFDGSVFLQCLRTSDRIDFKNPEALLNLPADAVIFGNISEMKSSGGKAKLTATQVEIKLVDRATGEEIVKVVNRSSTDGDKVAMPIVRSLSAVIKKARSSSKQ